MCSLSLEEEYEENDPHDRVNGWKFPIKGRRYKYSMVLHAGAEVELSTFSLTNFVKVKPCACNEIFSWEGQDDDEFMYNSSTIRPGI